MKKTVSRRRFVGTAVLGAGALAAAAPNSLFGADPVALAPVLKNVWTQGQAYLMEFASAMPAEKFGFKPTEEVFSFAEQLLHLAGTNFWCFSVLKGEQNPKSREALDAKGKTAEEVIALLKESFAYGEDAISGLDEQAATRTITRGSNRIDTWKLLLFCSDHITHHRGQIVTYLRLNGITPPEYRSGFFG